jgi:hypothetical protein
MLNFCMQYIGRLGGDARKNDGSSSIRNLHKFFCSPTDIMAKCNALIRGSEDCFPEAVPKKVVEG